MKIKLLFILLIIITTLSGLDKSTNFFSQVITKDEIVTSGIVRISEVLLLVDASRIISHEGFTWKASINGLSSYQNQSWRIMIDGVIYNRTIFDVNNLNMLPITLNNISFIEISNLPLLSNSGFAGDGVLHFHTDKLKSFTTYAVVGSETHDAGPYITIAEKSSPNVDKTGPLFSTRVINKINDIQVIASFIGQSHNFSDSKLRNRNTYTITDGETWAGITRIMPSIMVSKSSETSKQELYADFSYSDKYPFYLENLGREIPTYCTFGEVGYKLEKKLNSKKRLSTNIQYSNSKLKKYPNIYDFDFDWNLHKITSNIELQQDNILDRIGLSIEYDKLNSGYDLDKNDFALFNLYANSCYSMYDNLEFNSSFELTTNLEKLAPKATFQQIYSFDNYNKLLSSIAYIKDLPEENPNLHYWERNGYNLLESNNYNYNNANKLTSKSKITYDLIYKSNNNKLWGIYLSGVFRNFNDLSLENDLFTFNEETYSFDSPVHVINELDGNIWGINLSLTQKFNSIINHKIFFSHQEVVNGDELFIAEWKKIPTNKFTYQCNITLFDDLKIGLLYNYFSKTEWENYEQIDTVSYSINSQEVSYTSSLEAINITNLKISKKFLNDKITGSLILQNLFDQNYSYHPIGASFDLAYFIVISVDL